MVVDQQFLDCKTDEPNIRMFKLSNLFIWSHDRFHLKEKGSFRDRVKIRLPTGLFAVSLDHFRSRSKWSVFLQPFLCWISGLWDQLCQCRYYHSSSQSQMTVVYSETWLYLQWRFTCRAKKILGQNDLFASRIDLEQWAEEQNSWSRKLITQLNKIVPWK